MAVDRSKFRTCTQTSFCRRHRNGKSQILYQYTIDPKSIVFHTQHNDPNKNVIIEEGDAKEDTNEDPSITSSPMQKLKNIFKRQTNDSSMSSTNNEIDPYVRGPEPFLTAKLVNKALITSTGSHTEGLNLSIHLLENGIARIRITEEYSNTNNDNGKGNPYDKARWTSDELILEYNEMKYASEIETFMIPHDNDTNDTMNISNNEEKTKDLLNQLLSTLNQSDNTIDYHNYMALRYGNLYDNQELKSDCDSFSSSSYLLIQYQPFALHFWRDSGIKCNNEKKEFGQPVVSVNSDNLLHVEIRRLKEQEKDDKDGDVKTGNDVNSKGGSSDQEVDMVEESANKNAGGNDENDRHGGKEIIGYWEDGLAIYADGTREERKEGTEADSSIVQDKRRSLMDESSNSDSESLDKFQIDTNGMWEEKFGDHLDTKPYGPMSVGADIKFPASNHLFGLPEHASSTQLKGTTGDGAHYKEPYRLYNLDVFEYELDETMSLYGEVPLIVSQSKSSGTVGVFWFNPTETFIDVEVATESKSTKTHWISESGIIDLFLLPGPNPETLYRQYASLTGRMPLPPMWSLGYHQCRWNYRDEEDVFQVHEKFEELDYPYDVLWLDIEHTDGKRYFTWDKNLFPNPAPMQEKLYSQGRKMVTIIDPHIKRDNNYYIHKTATAKGYYIKDKDGKNDYDGWCWPGSSSYLDFTNEKVRTWWAEQFGYTNYIGSTPSLFTWNDMNEPSVFNGPEVSMQKDLRNLDGVEHREWHNLYGILFQRSTAEGLIRRNVDQNVRPFVLSRSFFAGR